MDQIVNNSIMVETRKTKENIDVLAKAGLKLPITNQWLSNEGKGKSRDHYSELFDFGPIGYLTLTDDGIIADSNHAAAKLFGVGQKKLIRTRFSQFIADDGKGLWSRHFLLTKQSDSSQSCELPMLRNDGVKIYVQLNSAIMEELNGTRLLLVTLNDITAQKQTDEALRIAAVAFETQDAMIVTDANKIILRVNEAYTRITGFRVDEVLGKTPSFLSVEQLNENMHQAFWVSVLSNGYWQGEVWSKRKNGESYPIWLTLTAVLGSDNCVSHYVCSFSDITAQKQAEKILLEARLRLERQVITTKEELEKVKNETAEINAALTVLLKHNESSKMQSQHALSREAEETILPFLKKLKGASSGRLQSSQLLGILEENLLLLISAYGSSNTTPKALQKLTPLETQVASMVRQGLPTKAIAKTLNITEGTVGIHRNHIRKKLGLNHKSDNLQVYLKTLLD